MTWLIRCALTAALALPVPASAQELETTKEDAQVPAESDVTCESQAFASDVCVAMLEFGPVRVVRGRDLWKPLLLLGVAEGGSAILRDQVDRCHWCDVAPQGEDRLNRVDRWGLKLRWTRGGGAANAVSWATLLATAAVPAWYAGRTAETGRFARNFTIIMVGAVSADAITSLIKVTAARERPYSYRLTKAGDDAERSANAYRSFFSGHTSAAFAATVVGARLLELYRPDHGKGRRVVHPVVVWAPALLTGYLRIAADKHFATDVATGAVAGYLIGSWVAGHVKPGIPAPGRRAALQPVPVSVGSAAGLGLSASW